MSNSPPREPRSPPKSASASAPAKLPLKGMHKPLSTETPQRDLHRRLYMKDYNKTYKGKQGKEALSAAKAEAAAQKSAADLSRARLDFALNQADVEADCFFGLVGMNLTRSNNMASISSQALMSPGSNGGANHHHYQQSFHTYGSPPPHSPAPYGNPPIMSPQGNGRAYYYHHHNNANMYSGTPPPAYAQNYDQPSHHMLSNTMHSLHVSPAASRRAYRHPNNANNAAPRRHHAPTGFNEHSGNGNNSNRQRQRSSIVQDDDDVMSLGEEQPQESIDVPLEEEASEMEEEPQEVAVQGKKRVRKDDEEQLQPASSKKRKVEQQEPVVADEQSTATANERALVFAADDTESIPVADDDNDDDDDDDDDAMEIGGIDGDQQELVLADKQSAAANNTPVADDIDIDDDANAAADDAMEIGGIDDNAAAADDAMEIGGIDGDETVAELQPADQQFVAPPEHDGREIFPVSNEEELQITPSQAMLPLGAGPGLFGSPNRGPRGQRILNEAGRWGDPRDPQNREIAQNIVDAEDREDAGNMDRALAVAGMAQQHRIHAGQMAVAAAQADQSEADRAQRQAELEAQNIRDLRARIKEEKGEGWTWSLLLTSLHFIMAIGKILWNRVVDFSDYYCLSVWAWNPINHLLVNSPPLATAFWFLTNAIGFTHHTYETVKEYFVWAKGASEPEPDLDGGNTCYFDTFVVVAFFCFFLWAFKWLVPESMQNVVAGGILMLVSVIKFLAVGEENADHEQFLRKSPVVFAVVSFLVSWCFLLSRFNKFLKGNPTFEELQEHLDTFNERNENFGFIQVCYVSIVFLLIFFDIV